VVGPAVVGLVVEGETVVGPAVMGPAVEGDFVLGAIVVGETVVGAVVEFAKVTHVSVGGRHLLAGPQLAGMGHSTTPFKLHSEVSFVMLQMPWRATSCVRTPLPSSRLQARKAGTLERALSDADNTHTHKFPPY
jgi:hypothetical protein